MFSEEDLKQAIEQGIFNSENEVTANPSKVIRFFEKWAELKCKETARNVRHKAVELYFAEPEKDIDRLIMNIRFEDIKPN